MFMYSFFIEILYVIANAVINAVRFVFAKVKEAVPKIPKAVMDEIARACFRTFSTILQVTEARMSLKHGRKRWKNPQKQRLLNRLTKSKARHSPALSASIEIKNKSERFVIDKKVRICFFGDPDRISRIHFSRASTSAASEKCCLPLRCDVSLAHENRPRHYRSRHALARRNDHLGRFFSLKARFSILVIGFKISTKKDTAEAVPFFVVTRTRIELVLPP